MRLLIVALVHVDVDVPEASCQRPDLRRVDQPVDEHEDDVVILFVDRHHGQPTEHVAFVSDVDPHVAVAVVVVGQRADADERQPAVVFEAVADALQRANGEGPVGQRRWVDADGDAAEALDHGRCFRLLFARGSSGQPQQGSGEVDFDLGLRVEEGVQVGSRDGLC
ncbi:MAG: hypothetical protein CMM85_09935 [Rhodothermaceae bacterium]|nr:hypothetical protein [Rhodothermaceae bacterium]